MASGATWDGGDDESMPSARTPDLPADDQQPPRPDHSHRGGLLGWLFGSSDEDDPAPAAIPAVRSCGIRRP